MTSRTAMRVLTALFVAFSIVAIACEPTGSDAIQQRQQETILAEGTNAIGMPAIKNFRERRLMKMILEMRDQNDVSTFTYLWSDVQGRWVFFCNSIGYGIPYATQYTNPQKVVLNMGTERLALPQADPNGLFSPASADGTWVMCKDPKGSDVKPVFIEPRSIVSPFELPMQESTSTISAALPITATVLIAPKK